MLSLLAILTAAICGLVDVPAWSIACSGCALTSLSYARHHLLFRRAADLGMQSAIDSTLLSSLLNGLAASAMAYGCGVVLRFLAAG